jgi:hypothetical protein
VKKKKRDRETQSIANAVEASKEVRRRAIEKKKGKEPEVVDDVVPVQVSDVPEILSLSTT